MFAPATSRENQRRCPAIRCVQRQGCRHDRARHRPADHHTATAARDEAQERTPKWEVRLGSTLIGWKEAHKIGSASATFYFAYGVMAGTDETVDLESSIEFDERVDLLQRFHAHPMVAEQHIRLGYSGDRQRG